MIQGKRFGFTMPSLSLFALGLLSLLLYGVINKLSWQFDPDFEFKYSRQLTDRPIIAVLLLFAAVFACYLLAIFLVRNSEQNTKSIWVIASFAVLFRVAMLFSCPIQEVDIYRYLWDGEVSSQGISPFRFAPAEILLAKQQSQHPTQSNVNVRAGSEELDKLVALSVSNRHVAEVLRRVHFSELPTVYPPTSQLVFYGVAIITPDDAAVFTRVWIMKACLTVFDLGVLFLLIKLLNLCRLPIELSVMYAWCPLVMKEVANSGHLDTIAMFLTMLAVYVFIRMILRNVTNSLDQKSIPLESIAGMVLTAMILAAAVGAKLYPVVIAPLFLVGFVKRFGWKLTIIPAVVFLQATFVILTPILYDAPSTLAVSGSSNTASEQTLAASPEKTTDNEILEQIHSNSGVTAFLKYWEMNDFVFMVVVENLQPDEEGEAPPPAVWFAIFPNELRHTIVNYVAHAFSIPKQEVPFLITRGITSGLFLTIALWLALRAGFKSGEWCSADGHLYCEVAFLTLAWFWLLLPTQNPWYWMWALSLLPFVQKRAWLAMSGLVLIYYLRFWLDYHCAGTSVWGTPYQGVYFFDFIVTWIEFAPWFVWLLVEYWSTNRTSNSQTFLFRLLKKKGESHG